MDMKKREQGALSLLSNKKSINYLIALLPAHPHTENFGVISAAVHIDVAS